MTRINRWSSRVSHGNLLKTQICALFFFLFLLESMHWLLKKYFILDSILTNDSSQGGPAWPCRLGIVLGCFLKTPVSINRFHIWLRYQENACEQHNGQLKSNLYPCLLPTALYIFSIICWSFRGPIINLTMY